MTDLYVRLDYRQYKHLEDQLQRFRELESSHTSVSGYYHKAFRLEVGDVTFEFQGPMVKQPLIVEEAPEAADG